MEKPKTKKKEKTFNDLDLKFQLQPEDDPDKIFAEEKEMIQELRKEFPNYSEYSDKYLVTFLCARRHKLEETKKLMTKFMEKRKS